MQNEWVVPPDAKAKYDTYFQGIDKDHDGIVSGEEARSLFMASNLPPKLLAHVWYEHTHTYTHTHTHTHTTGTCVTLKRLVN